MLHGNEEEGGDMEEATFIGSVRNTSFNPSEDTESAAAEHHLPPTEDKGADDIDRSIETDTVSSENNQPNSSDFDQTSIEPSSSHHSDIHIKQEELHPDNVSNSSNSSVSSAARSRFPVRYGIIWRKNEKIEAMDFMKKWYIF